jgi:diguanylate cyclase (GGDEF)-like protein
MLSGPIVTLVALLYLGVLFAIAFYCDKAANAGRSLITNPYVYSLSLAVYASAATFYGNVGRAASSGIGFLAPQLGTTLMAALWWFVMRKIIRISKANRITSIADFIASRYGKSHFLAGMVTLIAVIGLTPYISLQLKAISSSFNVLISYPDLLSTAHAKLEPVLADTAFYVTMILACFSIAFGTRHFDAAERHDGMVAAVAFESLVKLMAFLCVGIFVTYGIYDGFGDLFTRAAQLPQVRAAFTVNETGSDIYYSWGSLHSIALLTMLAVIFLPRQFQVTVVENVEESHLNKATWLFPLYLLLINIFVLPIAFGGLMYFSGISANPDVFVLTLPLSEHQPVLALLVFVGGFSAATGMVIVETIALSTMVCNDLVMPVLLRSKTLQLTEREDLTSLVLGIRRVIIILGMLLAYTYYRMAMETYALFSIGLISLAAVAQFAPVALGGLYWKGATRAGALAGLSSGFLVWFYTLLLPTLARSGLLPISFLEHGPLGIAFLKPLQLFGLAGLDEITHAMLWSMLANVGVFIGTSVLTGQSAIEQIQAALFVDVFKHERSTESPWSASGSLADLHALLARFTGPDHTVSTFTSYAKQRGLDWPQEADAGLINTAEIQLASVIGAASAREMIASVIKEKPLRDRLTGLPNRALMLDRLNDALEHMQQTGEPGFALLYLSLDRFNLITDSLGRASSDQLLILIAQRLSTGLRSKDTLARLGSDEFALLLEGIDSEEEATRYANQVQSALAVPYILEGHEAYTTASIGIALGKPSYANPSDILRDAETANHSAVELGGSCTEVFESSMRKRILALLDMETRLRQAVVKQGDFEVYYQPIVALETGRIDGFEALVRMRRVDGSLVPPSEFIPLTEANGLILHIGRWVLTEACRQMRAWHLAFPDHSQLYISVNLAGRQFAQSNLVEQVEEILKDTGLDVRSLKLEVTETVITEHAEEAADLLTKLRSKGIRLLLDDFGTGYSSLSYLHRFPVNTLKIDASFVRRMDMERKYAEIIQTIVTLAHTLNMDLVAEGVETGTQLAHLRGLKVEYGQGYYFAKPLNKKQTESLIATWPHW